MSIKSLKKISMSTSKRDSIPARPERDHMDMAFNNSFSRDPLRDLKVNQVNETSHNVKNTDTSFDDVSFNSVSVGVSLKDDKNKKKDNVENENQRNPNSGGSSKNSSLMSDEFHSLLTMDGSLASTTSGGGRGRQKNIEEDEEFSSFSSKRKRDDGDENEGVDTTENYESASENEADSSEIEVVSDEENTPASSRTSSTNLLEDKNDTKSWASSISTGSLVQSLRDESQGNQNPSVSSTTTPRTLNWNEFNFVRRDREHELDDSMFVNCDSLLMPGQSPTPKKLTTFQSPQSQEFNLGLGSGFPDDDDSPLNSSRSAPPDLSTTEADGEESESSEEPLNVENSKEELEVGAVDCGDLGKGNVHLAGIGRRSFLDEISSPLHSSTPTASIPCKESGFRSNVNQGVEPRRTYASVIRGQHLVRDSPGTSAQAQLTGKMETRLTEEVLDCNRTFSPQPHFSNISNNTSKLSNQSVSRNTSSKSEAEGGSVFTDDRDNSNCAQSINYSFHHSSTSTSDTSATSNQNSTAEVRDLSGQDVLEERTQEVVDNSDADIDELNYVLEPDEPPILHQTMKLGLYLLIAYGMFKLGKRIFASNGHYPRLPKLSWFQKSSK